MADRKLKNWLRGYLKYTENHEANEKIHRWVGLSMIAASLERRIWIDQVHYKVYPNLYTVIVGPSGMKKSTAMGIGIDVLRSVDKVKMMSERCTAAALINQMQAAGDNFHYFGKDVKQSCLFIYASELKVFLEEVYGSTYELLVHFYDCDPQNPETPWINETKKDGRQKIYGPCLNLLSASTPAWLKQLLPTREMEAGLASRIVFVVETDPPLNPVPWIKKYAHHDKLKEALITDLKRISSLAGVCKINPDAKVLYEHWYKSFTIKAHRNKDTRFSGYYGRKPTLVLKLAMIASVCERDDLAIEQEHLKKAIEWLTEIEANMFSAFERKVKIHDFLPEEVQIAEYIQEKGQLSLGQLGSQFASLGVDRLREIIGDLVTQGRVDFCEDQGGYIHAKDNLSEMLEDHKRLDPELTEDASVLDPH